MRFHGTRRQFGVGQSGLHRHDLRSDDDRRFDLSKGHAQQIKEPDSRAREERLNPPSEISREQSDEGDQQDQRDEHAKENRELHDLLGLSEQRREVLLNQGVHSVTSSLASKRVSAVDATSFGTEIR